LVWICELVLIGILAAAKARRNEEDREGDISGG
jgi:hypothetical protein